MPERLSPYTRNLFHALSSRAFLAFLEEMTGIEGLIPDPYFSGGSIHVVANGVHLDIHADFNHHGKLNFERRLNVLIYLNKDWRKEWGGSFEIWNTGMTERVASFVPIFNRMVCFSTAADTGTATRSWSPITTVNPGCRSRGTITSPPGLRRARRIRRSSSRGPARQTGRIARRRGTR